MPPRHALISHLERGDAWDALGIPLSGSGRTFDLHLVGEIVERTAGYPSFLQFFGGFLCSRVGRADVVLGDYLALEGSLLHELDLTFFEDRYLVAGVAGQRVLDAMPAPAGACRHSACAAPWPTSRTSTSSCAGSWTVVSCTGRRAARMTSPCPCSTPTSAGGPN